MKYQVVLQHSEEDCGAACLASVSKYYGRHFSLNHIREAVGTGQLGTTLLGLRRGAESLGFNARSVKASPEILNKINEAPLPGIIHWKGSHWVILYGQSGRKYVIADPAAGIRYLSQKELTEGWANWVMLLLEPNKNRFFSQPDDKVDGFGQWLTRLWHYRAILFFSFLCAFVVGLLSLASPILIQILTDDVLIRSDTQLLTGVVMAIITMYLVSTGLSLVQNNLIAHFTQRLELELILEFGQQILQLPLGYYEARRSGEIISRLRDIREINQLVSQVVVSLPSELCVALVSFTVMLFYSWQLTFAAILIVILMTLSTVILLPTLQTKTRNLLVLEAETQGVLVETFKGALTLKSTTAAPQFWEEIQSRFGRLANLTFRTIQISIINSKFSSLVSNIGRVILLWYGSYLVINQTLSIGQLLAFISLNSNIVILMISLIDIVDEFARVKTATARIQEVIMATPETQNNFKKPWAKISGEANIVCTNLNFHYPGRLELIENFSVEIPGGKVIALIGKSGCGKSTLAKLIAGLYPLQSGNIRIGMYNLQDLDLDCLRQQIVLVPQEAHFWSRTIVENFRLGSPQVTFEQIVKACQIASADDFINQLPEKYQTVLGEFGANISGGQRQRLAIARAIVKDPPILILDESTSGLDPVSEAQVLNQILLHRQGKTTLLISHRPKIINRADWIVLLNQGKLQIQGSLEELRLLPGEHLEFIEN
ncbi:ABC transporter ATP-binding protein [Calothrix sp. PCC 7716]|nr:ABC transporter ATP-binding protein [Calothrix sp. PCC 7716]